MASSPSQADDIKASNPGTLAPSHAEASIDVACDDEANTEASGGGDPDTLLNEKARHGLEADTTTVVTTTTTTTIPGSRLGETSPISNLYLSFDTDLPPPAALQLDDGSPIPPRPDLNPFISPSQWSVARKVMTLALSCSATFLTALATAIYSPPAVLMAMDFHTTRLVVLAGITTFCVGFAITPMVLAPLSEIRGRRPVFISAGALFVLFQGLSSVMPNVAGMIVSRFLAGVGASVFSTVVGGVLADIWANHERNTPMSLFAGSALMAAGAGPLAGASLIKNMGADTQTWKWTFWLQTILDVALLLAVIFFFPESRRSVILANKAKTLNAWYEKLESQGVYGVILNNDSSSSSSSGGGGDASAESPVSPASSSSSIASDLPRSLSNDPDSKARPPGKPTCERVQRIRWVIKEEEQRASLGQIIAISVKRPFQLLITEPVVFCFSLWAAFSWAVLYLSFCIVPLLYTGSNSFGLSSRVYVALMIASVLGTIASILQDRLLKHPQWKRHDDPDDDFQYSDSRFWALLRRHFPAEAPESRLYFAAFTSVLLPTGLFLSLLTPITDSSYTQATGFGLAIWGIYAIYLSTFNYLADAYHTYASSALAAQSCCRNLLGGVFPLITGLMFQNLGAKGMGGLLGGIGTVLTLIPWVLIFFGEKIRAKSKVALSLKKS